MNNAPLTETPVQSPCTLVCTIDAASGLCLGCARSLNEIALWSSMSNDERRAVIKALPDRHRLFSEPDFLTMQKDN